MAQRFKSKPAFAACIARGLKPGEAARAVGIDRVTAYRWRNSDPAFREMWDAALDERTEEAESQLFKAVQDGQPWAVMFALKHWCPEKYDRRVKVSVGGDSDAPPVTVEHRAMIFPLQARPQIDGQAEPELAALPVLLNRKKDAAA